MQNLASADLCGHCPNMYIFTLLCQISTFYHELSRFLVKDQFLPLPSRNETQKVHGEYD